MLSAMLRLKDPVEILILRGDLKRVGMRIELDASHKLGVCNALG